MFRSSFLMISLITLCANVYAEGILIGEKITIESKILEEKSLYLG